MNSPVQASHSLRVFLTIVLTVVVLRYAQEVCVPLALAVLMTFLLAPLVERLQKLHINRGVAVILSVAFTMVVLGGLLWVVFHQFADLMTQFPNYRRQFRANLADLTGALRGGVTETTNAVEQITREISRVAPKGDVPNVPKVVVVEPPPTTLQSLRNVIGPLLGPVSTAALVVVFVIFMLLRLPDLRDRVISLLGSKNLRLTTEALDEAAKKVSKYLVMQTVINSFQGICTAAGLYFIGVPNAILWGALTMALRFVPYVGVWVAAALPVALSFALFDHWTQPVLVLGLYVGLELFSYMVLEPWLYGSRTGVSPIALLVAAAFWTWLWGPIGLLLAIPVTVVLVVMGKYIPQLAFLHVLLGDQPVLEPHERLYQRLLASNQDEADALIQQAVRTQSHMEVCDSVIVPAVQLAEADYERGALPDSKRLLVFQHLEEWIDEYVEQRAVPKAPPGNPLSPLFGRSILCVPAEDRADEISSKLLALLLIEQSGKARSVPNGWEDPTKPDIAVVSALPPDAATAARRACKALRNRWHDVPIIVGLWSASGDTERARQRLEAAGADQVCLSFSECLALIEIRLETPGRRREVASSEETATTG